MTEVAPQPEDGLDLKATALLFSLRDNKPKEAIKLLHEGAGIDFSDQTGCLPLHYAAQNNYTEIIELLLEKDAKTFAWNNNGQTALHMAAMQGHVRSIVTLVARGARVDILDRSGRLALEYAVLNRHVATVELLCQFGSEPLLLDWSWIETLRKKTDLYAIAKILKRQNMYIPGYKHGAIRFDVAVVAPREGSVQLKNTDVEVKVAEGQELYYMYLSRREDAYGSKPRLGPDENVFGHLLECQTWGPRVKTITLTVTVDRALRRNEEVVLRPATKTGRVVVEDQVVDGVGITIVTLTVPLKPTGMTHFAMVSRVKRELFRMSMEAVVLNPENEPEAEIDIPAGTFDSGELSVKFVDTTETSDELEQGKDRDAGKSVLMTSILDLSTTNHKQPKNEIKMKMPVTVKGQSGQSEDVCVLMISNPDPNLVDWEFEKIQAEIDDAGKSVFSINHFSVYAATSKSLLDDDPQAAIDEMRDNLQNKRRVDFLVAVKTPEVDKIETEMVLMCTTKRKMKLTAKKYEKSYTCYRLGSDTQLPLVPEGQMFQIAIRGNVKDLIDNNNVTLTFNDSKLESTHPLAIVSTSDDPRELKLSGEVDVIIKTGLDKVPTADVGCCSCFNSRTTETESELSKILTASPLCTIPFTVTLTKRDETCKAERNEEDQPMDELEKKDKCIIPALMWRT